MRISIATPCLNCSATIEKTILSVINEKRNNDIEYIIIDGQSTDGTIDIINKYNNDIDVFVSEKDDGLYDAFNKCVKNASGDYVFILAADDYLLNGAIESFRKSVKPDTEVWTGSVVIYHEGYFQYMFSNKNLLLLRYCCSLRHPATFFKQGIFEKYGYYNSELKISGDRDIFLRMYEGGANFQIEDVPIVFFSMDGISNKKLVEQAIPEEKKISLEHGLSLEEVDAFYNHSAAYKIKNALKAITVLTHTYHLLCKVTGRGEKFITKKELRRLGVIK